ncbi:GNAT family N-acetyltransferase [Parvibaculum sp.]|uniref:GNAT family N-acetyltransferase n=1 Tax=Parvibaculum sp. TaxID=2024848 RepID=UPI001D7140E1|nr:GNAT family N-acetyltransferase [Parvibaculum sp.]MBX3488010.1 GNAT family N-acetyltransferase [Parvibaculum sp.]MCW5728011.1 GNAT family N-acetyltransferase [Parvibaculum sp.]
MTDIRRYPLLPGFGARDERAALLSVETLSHAARYAYDRPPSADIVVLESADAMTPYLDCIDELTRASTDTNPQFESVTLAASMEHLQGGAAARVALVWSAPDSGGKRQLLGVFPYKSVRGHFGIPAPVWSLWEHIHSYTITPLVRAGHERHAIRRFLDFADQSGAALVRFPVFEALGAFDAALDEVLHGRAWRETDRHERAFLQSDLDEDAYLATHIRKKKRKEFSRLWNRLAEQGDLKFVVHEGGEGTAAWVQRFLTLEAAGWKGKRGTALKVRPHERAWFEAICAGAAAQDKLVRTELTLDGKPVAMLASFRAGAGLYTFKIAFDEAYAKYSPGTLLMLKGIGAFLRDGRTEWVDSCAIPGHPMIDHIWAQRRTMRSVTVATRHRAGPLFLSWSVAATRLAENARARLRVLYYRFRKEIENDQAD